MDGQLPQILLYAHFKRKEQFDYEYEIYDCAVLFLLTQGSFMFRNAEGLWQTITAGELVFCPAGFAFYRKVVQPIELHMIKLQYDEKASGMPGKPVVLVMKERMVTNLHAVSPAAFRIWENIDALTRHYCTDVCLEVFGEFARGARRKEKELPEEIRSLLEQHFMEDITNAELCELLACSEVTLINMFRKATGQTPQQYLMQKRLTLAKRLLADTDDSIGLVAEKCGYSDALYFSRLFKRFTGMTASEFRKIYKL